MSDSKQQEQPPQSIGFWRDAMQRFRRRKLSMLALYFVVFLIVVAVFSPAIVGTKPVVCKYKGHIYFPAFGYFNRRWENAIFLKDKFRRIYPVNLVKKDPDSWAIWPLVYQDPVRPVRAGEREGDEGNPYGMQGKPSWRNLFGTDKTGVDVFAKMVHGTRTALLIGFVATSIAAAIGIFLGAMAGYFGSWVDIIISRFIELIMCIPGLVLILAVLAVIEKPTIWHLMVVVGITSWTGMARLTRAEFLKLRETEFVTAARSLGASWPRIMFRHILPNAMAPVMVPIVFGIAAAILVEAGLSLLGLGPSSNSWGAVLQAGRENRDAWWLIVFPGIAIFLTVLAYNLIGEGWQECTDPRMRQAKH
jgi:peptide/nickel transport system permease protein